MSRSDGFLEAHRRLLRGLHVRFSSMIENIELAARSRMKYPTIHGRESRGLKRRAREGGFDTTYRRKRVPGNA
jgi:hypothetical protein